MLCVILLWLCSEKLNPIDFTEGMVSPFSIRFLIAILLTAKDHEGIARSPAKLK